MIDYARVPAMQHAQIVRGISQIGDRCRQSARACRMSIDMRARAVCGNKRGDYVADIAL